MDCVLYWLILFYFLPVISINLTYKIVIFKIHGYAIIPLHAINLWKIKMATSGEWGVIIKPQFVVKNGENPNSIEDFLPSTDRYKC